MKNFSKKISFSVVVLILCMVLAGCQWLFGDSDYTVGETVKSSDSYLTITARSDGLLIKKSHPDSWIHVTIHITDETTGLENAKIETNEKTNKFLYPFVKKGDKYQIYIEKQEYLYDENEGKWKDYQNWGTTDTVEIKSIGGQGNFAVGYKKYSYDPENYQLTLKNLNIDKPDLDGMNPYFDASLFLNGMWTNPSKYGAKCVQNGSVIDLSDSQDFLNGAEKVYISLSYKCTYEGISYSCPVLSGLVYRYSEFNEHSILTGGIEIPNVYLTSSSGYDYYATYHFGNDWQKATISIKDPNGEYDLSSTSISIKDRGNSTKWPGDGEGKTPFSIKFSEKTKVLGMKKAKRWVLMANYFDRSLIRTELAGYLGNNVFNSYWNASFTPVNVYLNGRFIGTYDFGECNKIAKQRINVQSLEDYADGDSEYSDVNGDGEIDINDAGFMVEIDTAINYDSSITADNYKSKVTVSSWSGAERIYFYSAEKCLPMTLKEPDFDDDKYSNADCLVYGKYAKSKIDAFETMLYSDDFASKYEEYIDVTSFVDWYLINELSKNSDANFQKSVPVTYNPATGKLYMGPNWDFDLGFGNFNHSYSSDFGSSTVDEPKDWYIYGGRKGCTENSLYCEVNKTNEVQSWWINRLMEDSNFKNAVKQRWNEKSSDLLEALNSKIIDYANAIYDYIPENEAIIPRLGKYSWNGPSGYENRPDYEDEIDYLLNWCLERRAWMDSEINKW